MKRIINMDYPYNFIYFIFCKGFSNSYGKYALQYIQNFKKGQIDLLVYFMTYFPKDFKLLVKLRFEKKYTLKQCAEYLHCSIGIVRRRLDSLCYMYAHHCLEGHYIISDVLKGWTLNDYLKEQNNIKIMKSPIKHDLNIEDLIEQRLTELENKYQD